MVFLILAAVWAAFLIPPAVRRRAEGRPGDSISNFRRQLSVLRRTAPPAGRSGGDHWYRPQVSTVSLARVHPPVRAPRSASVAPRPRRVASAAPASTARSRTIRRRRDVLTALVVAVLATLVLGLLPAFRVMLLAHLVADVLLVAYVALLIRQRNLAAERELKVRFLPQPQRLDPVLLRAEPALLRRSAN